MATVKEIIEWTQVCCLLFRRSYPMLSWFLSDNHYAESKYLSVWLILGKGKKYKPCWLGKKKTTLTKIDFRSQKYATLDHVQISSPSKIICSPQKESKSGGWLRKGDWSLPGQRRVLSNQTPFHAVMFSLSQNIM